MNVYFSGMIGSGKTTLGFRLAQLLERDFFDLDREMDRILGYSFHQLVQDQGWLAFRELEYSICKDFTRRKNAIIALGGGTVRYEWNRDILKGTGTIIHIDTPREVLIERVRSADRPRVHASTTIEEDIHRIWMESGHKYLGAADIIYETAEKSLAEEIRELQEIIMTLP